MNTPNPFDRFDDLPEDDVVVSAGLESNPFDQFDPVEDNPNVPQVAQPDFVERTKEEVSSGYKSVIDDLVGYDTGFDTSNVPDEINEAFGTPTQDPARKAQGALSDGISTVSNVAVDGGLTLLDSLIPDSWQEGIVDFSRGAWESISQTPVMQELLAAAQEGLDVYKVLAKEYPDEAARLNEVINISAVSPKIPKGGKAPQYGGRGLEVKGRKQKINNRRGATEDLLEPIGMKGDGELKYRANGRVEYEPSDWEKKRAEEVMRVPEVKPHKSYIYNRDQVRRKAHDLRLDLEEKIAAKGNPIVDKQKVKNKLIARVNNMGNETLLTGEAREKAILIYNHAQRFIDESDGTAIGMLNARRNLDAFMRKDKPDVFDSARESALKIANRNIRDSMNDSIEAAVGKTYRTSLDKQHRLLSAGDLLDAKGMKQATTRFGRLKQKLEDALGMKFPTTPLAAGATAAVGASVLAGYPIIGAALVGGGGLMGLRAVLKGPQAKIAIGELRQLANKYPIMKPEINAMIQLSDELEQDPEDGE